MIPCPYRFEKFSLGLYCTLYLPLSHGLCIHICLYLHLFKFPLAQSSSTFFKNYCPPKNSFWADFPPSVPFSLWSCNANSILRDSLLNALCFIHKVEQDFSTPRRTDFYPFWENNVPVESTCCSTKPNSIMHFAGICWIAYRGEASQATVRGVTKKRDLATEQQ